MAMGTPALNEPQWLKVARSASVAIPTDQIPAPGDGSLFVSDCLRASGISDYERSTAKDWATWGSKIDPKTHVPPIGSVVIVGEPSTWHTTTAQQRSMKAAPAHVGFLVGQSSTLVYVLGEGVVRAFPRKAITDYREPPR